MSTIRILNDNEPCPPVPANEVSADAPVAWEQIENGRYMPRRIRGSYLGRELG
jgi:hypothetical protein